MAVVQKRKILFIGFLGILLIVLLVLVLEFQSEQKAESIQLSGVVEIHDVVAAFELPGRIVSLYYEEGDRVRSGDLLALLDTTDYVRAVKEAQVLVRIREAEYEKLLHSPLPEELMQAESNYQIAKVQYEKAVVEYQRMQKLYESRAIPQEQYEAVEFQWKQAEAALKAAEATLHLISRGARKEDLRRAKHAVEQAKLQLMEAQRRLRKCRLYAPNSGYVTAKFFEVGEIVSTGQPVYTIAINREWRIRAYIEEPHLGVVYPGMDVTIVTDDGNRFPGKVGYISPVAEFTPKTVQTEEVRTKLVYRIRIIVREQTKRLRHGMPVTIIIPRALKNGDTISNE